MGLFSKKKEIHFDRSKAGFPVDLIGVNVTYNLLGPNGVKSKEKEFNTYMHNNTDFSKDETVVFRDDADLTRADIVLAATKASIAQEKAQAQAVTAAQAAKAEQDGSASVPSKLFISTTTPPPNLSPSTQEFTSTNSVKKVSKLSEADKKKLEARTGITIDSDEALQTAKDRVLANSRSQSVTIAGSEDDSNAIFTGDDDTVNQIEALTEKIDAIEANKSDCPDWMNSCPTLPGLDALKDKLAMLTGLVKYESVFDAAKDAVRRGLYTVEALEAWIKCPAYLAQKGLQGIRTLNKIGSFVSGLDNTNYQKVFMEAVNDAGMNTVVFTDPKGAVRTSIGKSNSSSQLSSSDLSDLFNAIKNGDVSFKPSALLSPFSDGKSSGQSTSGRTYYFTDIAYMGEIVGDDGTSDEPTMTQEVTENLVELADAMETDTNDLLMSKRTSAVVASGHMSSAIMEDGEDVDRFACQVSGEGVKSIESSKRAGNFSELATKRKNTLLIVDAMNKGDMSSVNDTETLITRAAFERAIADTVGTDVNVQSYYRREYAKISRGVAA